MTPTTSRLVAAVTASLAALAVAFSAVPATAQGPFELNIGSLAPKGTPWMDLLEKMEAGIETGSQNRINVIIRPSGVMGEVEMVKETLKGERLQGAAVTTAAIAEGGDIPVLSIVELPFLFRDNREADHVLDNVLWTPASDALAAKGLVLAVWSENGWRSMATKGKPVKSPDDLKELKMRSQESAVHMAMFKAFGATATQQPMTAVLPALQDGTINGLDNTALYIQSTGLAEAIDYFTLTRHIYQPAAAVYSKTWFSSLPPDLQKVLLDQRALATAGREGIRQEDAAMIENMSLFNVEVVELTDAERDVFAKKAAAMHASYAAGIEGGTEWYGKITTALKGLR